MKFKNSQNGHVILFGLLSCLLFCSLACSKVKYEIDKNESELTQIISDPAVQKYLREFVLVGKRETLNVDDLIVIGASKSTIDIAISKNIKTLYFPFLKDEQINGREFHVINLDQVKAESQLKDEMTGKSIGKSEIMLGSCIMYKTQSHPWDIPLKRTHASDIQPMGGFENAQLLVEDDEWLPWRRCYCSRTSILPDEGESSMGTCSKHHQDEDRCTTICDRTEFINQACSGAPCPGC